MRALKALVIVMGVIIVVGIAVVGVTVFNRLSKPTPLPAPVVAPVAVTPPSPAPTPTLPGTALTLPIGAPLGTPMPQQFDRKFGDTTVTIPVGARVSDFSASGDRLVLRVVMPNQEQRLLVVDLLSGNLLGTIKLAAGGDTPNNGGIGLLTPLPTVNVPPRNKSEGLK